MKLILLCSEKMLISRKFKSCKTPPVKQMLHALVFTDKATYSDCSVDCGEEHDKLGEHCMGGA